ncbi:MAG: 30S ribosomal protein S16 [Elusimicrobia bacterium]|nr:30S ribosomal protein S16 [Elusimicrobiota bacterium]
MAVVIRLQRMGKPKQPYYRVVAVEKSRGPVGRPIEILGSYNPRTEDRTKKVQFNAQRYAYWLKVGARPSETVAGLLRGRLPAQTPAAGGKS